MQVEFLLHRYESGQGLLEYVLIIVLIVFVVGSSLAVLAGAFGR